MSEITLEDELVVELQTLLKGCSFKPLTGNWHRFKCSSTTFPLSLQGRHRCRSRS